MIPPLTLYREFGTDQRASLSVEPAFASEGRWLLRLVRGPLGKGPAVLATAYGPYETDELQARWDELVRSLEAEGYSRSSLVLCLADLHSPSRRRRALTALRLGRARVSAAVDPLLTALAGSTEEACSLLDALGLLGDPRAIPAVRPYAERKLLSRRRSGVEALRNLRDQEGLAAARERAAAELEPPVRAALGPLQGEDPEAAALAPALTQAALGLPMKQRGRTVDLLYELATPRALLAARALLESLPLETPHVWRYVKSVLKRSMLRRDHETTGFLAHRIERRAAETRGTTAALKSGKDGETRATPVFRASTQRWVRRAIARHLRAVARHWPSELPRAAAEVLVHYAPADARPPRGLYGEFAHLHLLNLLLWSGGSRLRLSSRTLRWRFRSAQAARPPVGPDAPREEAFPQLWDQRPLAYLRLLAGAALPEVHAFAARAVRERHPALLQEAGMQELTRMLSAPHEGTVALAWAELDRRWDPADPDWLLLEAVLVSESPHAHVVSHGWLRSAAPVWTRDATRAVWVLTQARPDARELAAELLVTAAPGLPREVRLELARTLLAALGGLEATEGAHAAVARVLRDGLLAELDGMLDLEALLRMLEQGSISAKTVAGPALGRRPGALAQLGLPRVLLLAEHEVAAVRAGAHELLRGALEALRLDPGPLFVLAESPWADTRRLALGLLEKHVDLETLGLEGLIALCDSNREDVQAMGRELVLRHFRELDPRVVMARLAEHPHPGMRRFALDMIEDHLPAGAGALEAVARFLLVVLLDVRPSRKLKARVFELLTGRGLLEADQARVAVEVLEQVVRSATRADRDLALAALVRLRVAWPELPSRVAVRT